MAPLVTFRVLFGLLHAYGALRFILSGWVEKLYGEPSFFFKFYGFAWVPEPSVAGAYLLYLTIAVSALAIALGWRYRIAILVFFLSFTWSELIDATNYLNHYYLVSLLGLLLIFIPAHGAYSLDVLRRPQLKRSAAPGWCRPLLMIQIGLVYFFAGLAKLNADWLLEAMPLAVWLPTKADFPVLGPLFAHPWTAFAFSWFGAFYDLTIVCWLLWRPSRPFAYLAVVVFHLLTWALFNIGLFPLIMITSTLIFFPAATHETWWKAMSNKWSTFWGRSLAAATLEKRSLPAKTSRWSYALIGLYLLVQLALPLRDRLYPGDSYWTEEGYRFGWRVMLVEKTGQATFWVHDPATKRKAEVDNREFLTEFQEKQMAVQPDFMLQYADHLATVYGKRYDIAQPKITAEVFVALNGRPSQRFVDPSIDLAAAEDGWTPKRWILPLRPQHSMLTPSTSSHTHTNPPPYE